MSKRKEKNLPLLSIVMANYNGAKYIEQAIQSILGQSGDKCELIIIDGGSTDNSVSIIKEYEKQLAYWVSESDKGQSDAFNKGFELARGKFLFWINSDDVLLPRSIKKIEQAIMRHPDSDWFTGGTIFFNQNGIITRCAQGIRWIKGINKLDYINVSGPTSVFSKETFDKVKGFDLSLHYTMDTDLWMRFQKAGYRYKKIKGYLWGFRVHIDSKTSHAFNAKANNKFSDERSYILKKNSVSFVKYGKYFKKLLKIITGDYFLALFHTTLYKNKNINNINY